MKVYNELELLTDCLRRWDTLPSAKIFEKEYLKPMYSLLEPMLSDFGSRWNKGLYDVVEGLDWETYRKKNHGPRSRARRVSA